MLEGRQGQHGVDTVGRVERKGPDLLQLTHEDLFVGPWRTRETVILESKEHNINEQVYGKSMNRCMVN